MPNYLRFVWRALGLKEEGVGVDDDDDAHHDGTASLWRNVECRRKELYICIYIRVYYKYSSYGESRERE